MYSKIHQFITNRLSLNIEKGPIAFFKTLVSIKEKDYLANVIASINLKFEFTNEILTFELMFFCYTSQKVEKVVSIKDVLIV